MKIFWVVSLLVLSMCLPSFAKEPLGRLVIGKGDIFRLLQGKSESLKRGVSLFDGERISTGENSFALIRLKDGSHLKMGAKSQLTLAPPRSKGIRLDKGSVFAKVRTSLKNDDAKGSRFTIQTKSAVAGVRGTEFFTSYGSGKGDIWLCVNEGAVEVSLKNQVGEKGPVIVRQGEGISVRKGTISDPRSLPWTQKLNWNMDPKSKDLENKVDIESAYTDLLDQDYD